MSSEDRLAAGVVGVGSMGYHHARVYAGLSGVDLVGVADVDTQRAAGVADEFDSQAVDRPTLFDRADMVSIAVPTEYHYETARAAIEAGCSVLVEKPFVRDPDRGRELIAMANRADVVLGVGHVERYNPAVAALADVVPDLDLVGIQARRLGPPLDDDRQVNVGVALDLMIHDIDVVRWLTGVSTADGSVDPPKIAADGGIDDARIVSAVGRADGSYAAALMEVGDVSCELSASRRTQHKIRDLIISAEECCVTMDYIDRSVQIHRNSLPSFVTDDGDLKYRHESVTERPMVGNGEPLERELSAFANAVREGVDPPVTGKDGVRAVELARDVISEVRRNRTGDAT